MKKILFFISLLLCANFMFAQTTATLTMPDIDVSGLSAGDEILVPINVEAISNMVEGFQVFLGFDDDVMTWNGTNTAPAPGVFATNPGLTPLGPDWLWNNNVVDELAFSWVEPTFYNPVTIAPGEDLIILSFTYSGALIDNPMPIIFGQPVDKVMSDDGTMVKWGPTELYDEYFGIYELTLNDGSLFAGGGPIPGLWTGAVSEDWFDGGNWDDGLVPDGIDVTITDVSATKAPFPVIAGGGIAMTGTLSLSAGASLTLAADGNLTTGGLFTNDGTFQILSDLNGYGGSYIDMAGVAGVGTFGYDRDMILTGSVPNTYNDPFGWHYLAAPFDGFTTDDLPDYFVNAWDQGTGMWMQYSNTTPCTPWATTPLNTLDAWSVNMDLTYPLPECPASPAGTGMIVEFMGGAADVHTGLYSTTLGFGTGAYQQWNMVSNPFPSGLDADMIAFGPNTVAATYFYDGYNGNYVYWATGLGFYPMASTLGFFVETTGPDAFAVDNTMRAHNPDWYWKNEVSNLLTLEATSGDRSDVLHVRFADNVTAGFDNNGDAHKLFATTQGLAQIYTTAGDEMLAINALPATSMVPMGFTSVTSGEYKISAIETSEFSNVVLEDLVTGEQTDLLSNSYTFDYTLNDDADRFMIHFTALGIGDNTAASINIWSNDHKIYVQSPEISGDIVVFNMMGQEVIRTEIEPGLNVLPVNDGNSYYVVKVIGSDVAKTGKVYVK